MIVFGSISGRQRLNWMTDMRCLFMVMRPVEMNIRSTLPGYHSTSRKCAWSKLETFIALNGQKRFNFGTFLRSRSDMYNSRCVLFHNVASLSWNSRKKVNKHMVVGSWIYLSTKGTQYCQAVILETGLPKKLKNKPNRLQFDFLTRSFIDLVKHLLHFYDFLYSNVAHKYWYDPVLTWEYQKIWTLKKDTQGIFNEENWFCQY